MDETTPRRAAASPRKVTRLARRTIGSGDLVFSNLTLLFALGMIAMTIAMVVVLNIDAMPAVRKFGLSFFVSSAWNAVTDNFGALPAIYGTLLTSFIGIVIATPISLGAAIFLAELAPGWIRTPASFLIEMLAAIPSVIIGLWGLFVLVPFVRSPVETWLGDKLGFLPFFQGPPFGVGFLAGGLILAIMIIPIITAISRDVMRAVPQAQREAMLALGATRWESISRAVVPYCRSGIIGAVILGLARALGETMAVTMVIGNGYALTASVFASGNNIASKIANEFTEASSDVFIGSLVELALILFAMTLAVNVAARLLIWRTTKTSQSARE